MPPMSILKLYRNAGGEIVLPANVTPIKQNIYWLLSEEAHEMLETGRVQISDGLLSIGNGVH